MNKAMTYNEWLNELHPSEAQAIEEMIPHLEADTILYADEILDSIVQYEGGIASGYEVRSVISRVYGIELG